MIGNRIKEYRLKAGMSQQDLARVMEISTSAVGMYEQNRRKPDLDVTKRLADVFGVKMEQLMGEDYLAKEPSAKSFLEEIFASNVFTDALMKERLPKETYQALQNKIFEGADLSKEDAQI
ncbi:MAG: helix-turn-helix domain-containing protein, partial [Clostridia bacterium]|nr:helix-turn-helix domain-containing protein [Clostridia bacterium]